ncbi:unnamed protein product [Trifolium pratense]|uniref:Uncharacterized protein n=1 Tax=Trifolium pratense TaxID=57577 RepID=A0ACB0LGV0_TRIPR|nr:unnamed protein product [Trifolium pratense]
MIQLDFNMLVEAIDSYAMFCYGFAVTVNVHDMISTSYISEYMQKTIKGKHSKKWDPGGVAYFFIAMGALQFKLWDPRRCFIVHGKGATIILHHYLRLILMGRVML